MRHPYEDGEGSRLWENLAAAMADLKENHDLTITTVPHYAIGYLCKRLIDDGLVGESGLSGAQRDGV
jgi:hypothetical protein